jgi:hypothetical protein
MKGLLETTCSNFSFSDRPRRNRPPQPLPRRQSFLLEPLESRLLLSVDFFAAAPVAPATNRADVGLGTLGGFNPIEPAISINTTDPGNVVVTSHVGLRASTNEGGTFAATSNFANVAGQTGNSGDTDTAFDSQGRLFWVNLVRFGGQRDVVIGEVNPTNGNSLGAPVRVPNGGFGDDKPFIGADANADSPFADNLYVAWSRFGQAVAGQWSVYFSRSTDHGLTWSAPLLLSDFDGPNNVVDNGGDDEGFTWPADVKVAPNGDVYVAYHAQPDINENELEGATPANPNGTSGKIFVLRSTDGGQTFTQKTEAFTDGQADVTYNRQSAAGLIPGTDFWTVGSPQPWVLPDPTRPGFVYVVSNDDPNNAPGTGDDGNVVFARSGDNGLNWITSTISSGPANSFQLFPTASIDEFGNIVVAWYDNRRGQVNDGPDNIAGNADDNFLLDVFATYSIDGGLTWAPDFIVNDAASPLDPDIGAVNRFTDGGPPTVNTTRIGEYFGLDHFGGTAHLAWNGPNPLTGAQTGQQVVYSTFAISGQLTVTGDDSGAATDDVFTISRMAANTDFIEVRVNGIRQYAGLLEGLTQINIDGLGGNDTLIVDSSNGLISVPNGIRYDGDGGVDGLQLLQTGGPTWTSDTYSVGPAIGSGVSTIVGGGTAGTQVVFFEDLSPVLDLVPALQLTVNATATDNAINYSVGSLPTRGLVTIDEHEPIEFGNKTALTINAGAGQDTISLNNPNTPTGLTGITINGGDPSSGDTLIVTGVGSAVAVNTATATISGATGVGGAVPISYGTIETLNLLAGIGDLTLTTTGADDTVVVTPGLSTGANSGTVQSSGAVPQIAFTNSGTFTANLGAGDDALVVNGSSSADTVAVSGTAVAIATRRTVNYTGVEDLTVNGHAGSDTFNVTPSAAVAMFIDGGDPVGVLPGDLLNIIAGGGSVTFNAGPETDEGGIEVVGGANPGVVSFDHIESFGITGSGPAVINGTNGPDAITVIARDASTHPAADGVRDFTVSVNIGPELLFINVASLTINALSGSDQVTLATPAPNNAIWDVDVTVNGGPPAADTDRLIVQTPGTAAETVVYTPTASDGGTLDLTSLSSLVTINTIEVLSYDGQGDNDNLTIVGTVDPDTIVHNPGTNDQAGSFQVNSLLALSYQNVGSGASLTANGSGGTDTLVYNGTAANDTFTIGSAGQVNLNSRVVLNTTGVEVLTLEGFNGDDIFTLVPAISASIYQTINLNGGGQASATGDRVNLIGTGGADNIVISGQVVSLGGVTINSSGIEAIYLDAKGGDDSITYNGVSGVTENITVSSSGVEGSGQVNVPGVTLVNFSDVKWIDVNGNPPTPTETDTLTFAGTNAADTFQINLAAAGTNTDPILQLQNGSGTALLTLRNYTNFDTLRTLGLDGTDTFNVTTAGDGPSRNLFVDGGLPSGKKKSTDNLNIFYTPPRPKIIHSAATQDPDAGLVDLDYGTARFVVQYDDIEQVVIRRN